MDRIVNRRTFAAGAAAIAIAGVSGPVTEAAELATPSAAGEENVSIQKNKALVVSAVDAFFNRHDLAAIDLYLGAQFKQHSTEIADGQDGLRQYLSRLDAAAAYELVRVFGDGDLVATHGRYSGFATDPLIAFDIYRIDNDKIVEHWAGFQIEAGPNPSGHTMLDGPTAVALPDQTESTRSFLNSFAETILIGQQFDLIADFIGTYTQHNPEIADGLEGLGAAQATVSVAYHQLRLMVVEGEFGLLALDGLLADQPSVYYDLFRVIDGKIDEHWDVIQSIPVELPHDNGLY
jgi:predicted SnoaL-like aldol condensation-catalyzing enzyme